MRVPGVARTLSMLAGDGGKKKVVFLGTPEVATIAFRKIFEASKAADSTFEVSAVVSNPPAKANRKKELQASNRTVMRCDAMRCDVWTPTGIMKKFEDSAEFLEKLESLSPDLCITAAYGQFLTKKFLTIPRLGTVNIHPSLLPKYRGASPVPRALEDGVAGGEAESQLGDAEVCAAVTGVSVLFTQFEMDAGPIIRQEEYPLTGDEKADQLLPILFDRGSELLLSALPGIFEGKYQQDGTGCIIQNDEEATYAAKMNKEESKLWFTENAKYMHNRVRAFAGWPGTTMDLVINSGCPDEEKMTVKIVTSRIRREQGGAIQLFTSLFPSISISSFSNSICDPFLSLPPLLIRLAHLHLLANEAAGNALVITCDDGSQLDAIEVQPPGKKPMDAKSFWNGMRGRSVERARVPWSTGKVPT
ncbi:hypothetical protein GUITHDRAFT_141138 [Guillardia theta CCMP2712]|uniref:methionyl-tRNA formyltransferase n=1 Tax=Guillardia theta (strain CCMP2712) TaxID=905079 RepID=L1J2T2_GUITC|nr:hypothetical protein GUITHDRAFT_141138 [Guillardia theta CCMP2712]EKX42449.1 hypothetical protein GUITHDRAFT_141138 [Guillardia theta CCMP2712]|eukprot:XP_005829429.1 hypothetical protein GUITHDRAFT_141138 [Guillardia theta CCMP2712]